MQTELGMKLSLVFVGKMIKKGKRYMKKRMLFALVMILSMMISSSGMGYAENNTAPEVVENEVSVSTEFVLNVHVDDRYNIIPQNMVFGIYSKDKQFWGARHFWSADNNKDYTLVFEVPEYKLGETLYISVLSGAYKVRYGEKYYAAEELIPVKTGTYKNTADITATPYSAREVKGFANGWELYFKNPAKIINGTAMIPLEEYLEALSMKDCMKVDEESGRVEVEANGHRVLFFVEGHDMYADGKVTYTDNYPIKINGAVYVPFRFFVESMGGTIETEEIDGALNVRAELKRESTPAELAVIGIKSRTNYLVWVSKKDFKTTVFTNYGGPWKEVASFPCSIGAPSTETVTGEFEYFSRESRWSYPTYYVGPIMRFYRGYALHSTLLRYDGSDADARLEKKISHGCVRLAPESINWMVDNVPLYTKVYVTE